MLDNNHFASSDSMDSLNQSAVSTNKNRWSRAFTKVLQTRKTKLSENLISDKPISEVNPTKLFTDQDEKFQKFKNRTMDAFIGKVFATVSSVKATYAQLQYAQSPYDPEGIQSADQIMVSALKRLSEFKQSFLKKHLDDNNSPETTQVLSEIQELKNLIQMYDITTKKLDSERKLKDSEIIFLKEKLDEANRENKLIEKRLSSSGPLSPHEKLNFSSLSPKTFVLILQQTTKTIRSFVKFMMSEMEAANWDLNSAASSIQPDIVSWDNDHTCYAFESFVCRVMFDGFNDSSFSMLDDSQSKSRRFHFDKFMEMKSLKAREYITWKPNSMFATFCWSKYLKLVHPTMEYSLFGNLNQRNRVSAGKFPETTFFASFADVAKHIWILHCLAFAFDESSSIFQVKKGTRFTEMNMETVNDEPSIIPTTSPKVAFTVVPGFKLGKTVIQCQVYLT